MFISISPFQKKFCVGDKFFLKNNMILCQTDYEEGLMKEGYAPQIIMLATDSAEIAVVRDILEDNWKPAAAFSFKKKDNRAHLYIEYRSDQIWINFYTSVTHN
ncbi:LIM domain only protein 3, partial [Ophiophagus hannah]